MNKLRKLIFWVNSNRKSLLFLVLFIYSYSLFHELIHYLTASALGYSPSINWSFFTPQTSWSGNTPFNHFFLIAIMPYLFNTVFLFLLFMLNNLLKNNTPLLAIIAFFPAFNTLFNVAGLMISGNDFYGILQRANDSGFVMVIYATILICVFAAIAIYLLGCLLPRLFMLNSNNFRFFRNLH